MHLQARDFVAKQLAGRTFDAVVEIGGRNINGGVRDLVFCRSYVSIDLSEGPDVDVVADACDWQPPSPVELVLCCEVLEHAPDARGIVSSAVSWVSPGGLFVMTCATDPRPTHSAFDGAGVRVGEYYRNVAHDDFVAWVQQCGVAVESPVYVELDEVRGDLYAVVVRSALTS